MMGRPQPATVHPLIEDMEVVTHTHFVEEPPHGFLSINVQTAKLVIDNQNFCKL
jgi:hypothetical protein